LFLPSLYIRTVCLKIWNILMMCRCNKQTLKSTDVEMVHIFLSKNYLIGLYMHVTYGTYGIAIKRNVYLYYFAFCRNRCNLFYEYYILFSHVWNVEQISFRANDFRTLRVRTNGICERTTVVTCAQFSFANKC
jgi:hypothetical protein